MTRGTLRKPAAGTAADATVLGTAPDFLGLLHPAPPAGPSLLVVERLPDRLPRRLQEPGSEKPVISHRPKVRPPAADAEANERALQL